MCKINSSEHNILSYKCNDLKFCEHEFNSAQSANFVSTNLKTPVQKFRSRLSEKSAHVLALPLTSWILWRQEEGFLLRFVTGQINS